MSEDIFTAVIRDALARSGFLPPALNEVRAFIFQKQAFSTHVAAAAALLDAAETARAKRFRFDRDREGYTLAHAVWRIGLSLCLDVVPAEVPLTNTPSGQPKLPGTALSTSLSHTADWVAVAVCHGATVGIDIEQEPARVHLTDMAGTICTPNEMAQVMRLAASGREEALLSLWTRKEALLKAFGVGLGVDPSTVSADIDTLVAPPPMAVGLPPCQVGDIQLSPGLVGALAVPAGILRAGQHCLDHG